MTTTALYPERAQRILADEVGAMELCPSIGDIDERLREAIKYGCVLNTSRYDYQGRRRVTHSSQPTDAGEF